MEMPSAWPQFFVQCVSSKSKFIYKARLKTTMVDQIEIINKLNRHKTLVKKTQTSCVIVLWGNMTVAWSAELPAVTCLQGGAATPLPEGGVSLYYRVWRKHFSPSVDF